MHGILTAHYPAIQNYLLRADAQLCCAAGCGVVPVKHVHLSDWFQGGYGADGAFFHQLSERLPRTYMIPKVLFMYSGAHG